MILFNIYRSNSEESATGFDMGDIEFSFDGKIISSRGNSRLSNMIYVSIFDLIDGLLQLKNGQKRYEFVGADSSFRIQFDNKKQGIQILHEKNKYDSVSLKALLEAINSGIDIFLADPSNKLSTDSAIYDDFNANRNALKNYLS